MGGNKSWGQGQQGIQVCWKAKGACWHKVRVNAMSPSRRHKGAGTRQGIMLGWVANVAGAACCWGMAMARQVQGKANVT